MFDILLLYYFFSLTFNLSLTLTKPRDTRVKSCNCNVRVGRRLFYHAFNLLLKYETLDAPAWHHDGVREPRLRSGVWEVKAEHQQRDFQPFPLVLIYFSLRCFLSIAMHHLTLPKQAGAAQHQLKAIWLRSSTAARRIRLSLFRLLWNAFFFFLSPTSKIHKAAKLLTCVREPGEILHSFMPFYAKLPCCLFKEHRTLWHY